MTMQRRHFELIAKMIASLDASAPYYGPLSPLGVRKVAYEFARTLAATNPNFNRARFLKACGVEG